MDGIKLKMKTGTVEFDIEIANYQEDKDKQMLEDIIALFDKKTEAYSVIDTIIKEAEKNKKLVDKYQNAEIGYNALTSDKKGIHHGVDEIIAPLKQKETEVKPKESSPSDEPFSKLEQLEEQTPKHPYYEATEDSSVMLNNKKEKLYQTYYICPHCSNRGKRFVPAHARFINCHSCSKQMRIQFASPKGFPNKDSKGNIFKGGTYEPEQISS